MNYIHVHEKCLKCGECRLECEHRTKWTSASTSTSPNTESDKSIDEYLKPFHQTGCPFSKKYGKCVNADCEHKIRDLKSNLYSLLMDVIGGDSKFRKPEDELDRGVQIGYDACRVEIRQRLTELFNEKEK